jgi:hypothetical protein
MASHVAFGKQLVTFSVVSPKLRIQALQEIGVTLTSIISILKGS